MKGYVQNLQEIALNNPDFRKVLYTAKSSQLVLMSIPVAEEIGEETHHLDQFIFFVGGEGVAMIDEVAHPVSAGFGIVIPAGAKHNVINKSTEESLKLFTVYSPPEHKDGIVHPTKPTQEDESDHFDGQTSEQ